MEKIPKIHDKFFKQVFSHKPEMQDLILNSFPKNIVENLDFDTLELDRDSYIDDKLKEHFSDLVYHCNYKGKIKIKIAMLFEHKSKKPDYPHIQILNYITKVWSISIKQTKEPIFVLPIIFYQLQQYFKGIDNNLLKYLPAFDYILIDVSKIPDNEIIENYDKNISKVSLFLFKYIYRKQELLQKIEQYFTYFNDIQENNNIQENNKKEDFIITFYVYLKNNLSSEDMKTLEKKVTNLLPPGNDLLEYFARQNYNRGIEKGIEKGIERGIEKGIEENTYKTVVNSIVAGLDNKTIKIITGITFSQIEKIRKEIRE